MRQILAITRKELRGYFGSPLALIFVGAFLAVTLFTFFWVDAFFARGIADVRPLFRRMPVLLIFLVAALTMRQWSEEQHSGTLEILMTLPVSSIRLVMGKFLAVVALVALALGLTIFLPITVSLLGNLDWGPVVGGYMASLLLAAAYAAIGLFLSSRTDNQIVALISTALVCGLFYLIGSGGVTDFFGQTLGDIFRALGVSSHFESIERGVIDVRDIFYYLTLTGLFLTLNVLSLKAKGWSESERTRPQRLSVTVTSLLVALNLVFVNVWAFPLRTWRLDLTEERMYSLSRPTRELLRGLEEPLLIRGYFSEKTHPLLAPLVPRVRDMLREYEIASGGQIRLEIVDPTKNPEMEAEAAQVYGIQPSPFQVSGRYETSIVNAYFDILIQYGDQSEVLNFQDIIDVQTNRDGTLNVQLRNLEYDLTRTIRKVVYGFQSLDAVLASLKTPAELTLYVTPETLPEGLTGGMETVEKVAQEIADGSDGKFTYRVVNLDAPDSDVSRQQLYDEYGLQPIAISLFSDQTYYFYLVLEVGEEARVVNPTEISETAVRKALEATLKRFSSGFLQVVGFWVPQQMPTQNAFGQMQQPISSWQTAQEVLREEYEVRTLDLTSGEAPTDVDVMVLIAPQNMSEKERFAVDQYLMRGGAVIVAASHYALMPDQITGGLALQSLRDGLDELLESYGVTVERGLVLDMQNAPFPAVTTRQVGGVPVQQVQAVDYPYFVDVRADGMAAESPIVSNLSAVTMNWVSPVTVDEEKNADREVTVLLKSSANSWLQEPVVQGEGNVIPPNIQPDFESYPQLGFKKGETMQSYPLAISIQGVFESAYKDRPSPFETEPEATPEAEGEAAAEEQEPQPQPPQIDFSPTSARLVVLGSAEFLDDVVLDLSSRLGGEGYLNSLKLLQNAVAWATEDTALLGIRARGAASRVLYPLSERAQSFWEAANYVLALISLVVIGVVAHVRRRNEPPMVLLPPEGETPANEDEETDEEVSA
ncbi:MAG: Gldg family protein [Anaerolineae bacterium]